MPREHDHDNDAGPKPAGDEPTRDVQQASQYAISEVPENGAAAGSPASRSAEMGPPAAGATQSAGTPPDRKLRLITAVEIQNFKGIGRSVRIDLRPITLLFGPNSAGKSTVLHALCYAQEILSGGNVDVHETRLGGDQIDLGGFRRFVHAYARDREVRLRFELDLRGRPIPYLADSDEALTPPPGNHRVLSGLQRGWLALGVVWSGDRKGPMVRDCEVGVDGHVLVRISRVGGATADLRVNSGHPFAEYAKALLAMLTEGLVRDLRDGLVGVVATNWFDSVASPAALGPRLFDRERHGIIVGQSGSFPGGGDERPGAFGSSDPATADTLLGDWPDRRVAAGFCVAGRPLTHFGRHNGL